jgi:hypothetical protein
MVQTKFEAVVKLMCKWRRIVTGMIVGVGKELVYFHK